MPYPFTVMCSYEPAMPFCYKYLFFIICVVRLFILIFTIPRCPAVCKEIFLIIKI